MITALRMSYTQLTPARAGRVLFALAATLAGLLVAEAAFRILELGIPILGEEAVFTWVPSSPYQRVEDPDLGVLLQPGWQGSMVYRRARDGAPLRTVPVRISQQGLRGPDVAEAPAAGAMRLLAVGDSITFGQGVDEADVWASVTGRTMTARGRPVEALNAGVPSWSLRQEVTWLEARGPSLRPDIVVLGFFVDDILPTDYTNPSEPPPPIRMFPPAWARCEQGLRSRSNLLNYVMRRIDRHRLGREILRGRDDWRTVLREQYGDPSVRQAYAREITRFASTCRRTQARCLVLLFPLFDAMPADPLDDVLAVVADDARQAGLEVLSTTGILRDLPPADLYVFPGDNHPSPDAHRRVGVAVAEHLLGDRSGG